jgi:hypothetical protein
MLCAFTVNLFGLYVFGLVSLSHPVPAQEVGAHTCDVTYVRAQQPYLDESRHQHALKRARGAGGRFLNTKQKKAEEGTAAGGVSVSDAQQRVPANGGMFAKHEHSLPPGDLLRYHERGGA